MVTQVKCSRPSAGAAAEHGLADVEAGRGLPRSVKTVRQTKPEIKRGTVKGGGMPVFDHQGREIGEVRSGVLYKHVLGSRHQLQRPPGWAVDLRSLEQAEALGATRVEITDVESGQRYRVSIRTLRLRGFKLDRGYGRQLALRLELWARGDEPTVEQLEFPGMGKEAAPRS